MINCFYSNNPKLNQSKPALNTSFKGVPLYHVNVPQLVKGKYELVPAVFTRLSPCDLEDIKMVMSNKRKFSLKEEQSGMTIPKLFITKDYRYIGNSTFYALELVGEKNNKKRLLALATKDNIHSTGPILWGDLLNVRSDLQKKSLSFFNRKHKNVGELVFYSFCKMADESGQRFCFEGIKQGFYDKLLGKASRIRKVSREEIADFIQKTEIKFKMNQQTLEQSQKIAM